MSSEDIIYKKFHAPFDTKEKELWESFLKEKVELSEEDSKEETVDLDERWEPVWTKHRDTWLIPRTPTTPKEDDESESSDTEEPEPDQKGKSKMATTSGTTEIFLLAYEDDKDIVKMQIILSRMTSGDAAIWARNRMHDIVEKKLTKVSSLIDQTEERFTDHTRSMKADNDLYALRHDGKGSLITFLDNFEALKAIAGTSDETALIYLRRAISGTLMKQMFGVAEKIPDTYPTLMSSLRTLGQNMDIAFGYHQSLTKPNQKQTWYPSQDFRTGTGTIYGGRGQAMEIGQSNVRCYNCNGRGHISRNCRRPRKRYSTRQVTGKCFNCNQPGHWAKDCPQKRKELKQKRVKKWNKFKKRKYTRQVSEKGKEKSEREIKSTSVKPTEDINEFWEKAEVKQITVSNAFKPYSRILGKMTVTPRQKFFNRNFKLKAQIQCDDGSLKAFEPEVDNGCTITCIHPKMV